LFVDLPPTFEPTSESLHSLVLRSLRSESEIPTVQQRVSRTLSISTSTILHSTFLPAPTTVTNLSNLPVMADIKLPVEDVAPEDL
jgi:hypothetical protein